MMVVTIRRKNQRRVKGNMIRKRPISSTSTTSTTSTIQSSSSSTTTTTTTSKAKKPRTEISHFDKLRRQLAGGQFRLLNEQLYTEAGHVALARYRREPETFETYHAAYRDQVLEWPFNPLDRIADELTLFVRRRRRLHGNAQVTVADFGCGEANLARTLLDRCGADAVQIRSFDLIADANRRIEAADLAKVPLPDASVDVVVLCLALMGTDWPRFVREARRVLKPGGVLKLAEVGSRFTDSNQFVRALRHAGFRVRELVDDDNADFFRRFDCVLEAPKQQAGAAKSDHNAAIALLKPTLLQPCLYKRR
jgi:ribosomal RNA-processing protein 8